MLRTDRLTRLHVLLHDLGQQLTLPRRELDRWIRPHLQEILLGSAADYASSSAVTPPPSIRPRAVSVSFSPPSPGVTRARPSRSSRPTAGRSSASARPLSGNGSS